MKVRSLFSLFGAAVFCVAFAGNVQAQCVDSGGIVIGDNCGGVTFEGCCDNDMAQWCEDGTLCGLDCAPDAFCGWMEAGWYGCNGEETGEDPSGTHPLNCGPCEPDCTDKECGTDGCEGTCGECTEGVCAPDGVCCAPQCDGKTCGPDGCGGSCGECACGEACVDGACDFVMCEGKVCSPDGCGGFCGDCAEGEVCSPADACCVPSCEGKVCGDDGCGGTCGLCACGEACVEGACEFQACGVLECGDDGCGGTCGECADGTSCVDGMCEAGWICNPDYQGAEDGCDCECGEYDTDCDIADATIYNCEDWQTCNADGHCEGECVPDCTDKACGDDGCGGSCGECADGTNCNDEAQCVAGWICNPAYQGAEDGCDCDCGEYDPDCDIPDAGVYNCAGWQTCSAEGVCTPEECVPDCTDKICGDDGCGGSCGGCPLDAPTCLDGACMGDLCAGVDDVGCCDGTVLTFCGEDGLGSVDCATDDPAHICGWFPGEGFYAAGYYCGPELDEEGNPLLDPAGGPDGELLVCPECEASCFGKDCGANDGCGGTCGCPGGMECVEGQCFNCTPMCYARDCGDDGCGGSCGDCVEGEVCLNVGTCCAPFCEGIECGTDGCNGSCGECGDGDVCDAGACCTPACDGVTCGGDDGCGGTCGCDAGVDCIDGMCVDPCNGVTYEGCCDGDTVKWCEGGELSEVPCAETELGPQCGWLADAGYYWCGTDGSADPTGANPLACPDACDPQCDGVSCGGPDACGGTCGCEPGTTCEAGACVPCTAMCDGKECGDDGCGGVCGVCGDDMACGDNGTCQDPCMGVTFEGCCDGEIVKWCENGELNEVDCNSPDAGGPQCGWVGDAGYYWCGTDGAADPSGANPIECPAPPVCEPMCDGKVCGPDGCGGDCGVCAAGEACDAGACVPDGPCEPMCDGKVCGDNGCGGDCGTCEAGETCIDGACAPDGPCAPMCDGKVCGDDGCGGDCGACAEGETCTDGACVPGGDCVPACSDKVCGDNGCGGDCGTCATGETCNASGACVTGGGSGGGGGGGGSCTVGGSNTSTLYLVLFALAALAVVRRRQIV